jgi:hypothetical protein
MESLFGTRGNRSNLLKRRNPPAFPDWFMLSNAIVHLARLMQAASFRCFHAVRSGFAGGFAGARKIRQFTVERKSPYRTKQSGDCVIHGSACGANAKIHRISSLNSSARRIVRNHDGGQILDSATFYDFLDLGNAFPPLAVNQQVFTHLFIENLQTEFRNLSFYHHRIGCDFSSPVICAIFSQIRLCSHSPC